MDSAVPDSSPIPPEVLGRLSDGFVGLDADLRYTYLNSAAARILNVNREALIGDRTWPPDTVKPTAANEVEAALATQEKRSFPHYNPDLDQQYEVRVYPDEAGVTLYITDLTARQQEEETTLRSMYRITSDRTASFDSKVQELLDLGCEYLGLPYGFLTNISDDEQRIVQASGHHPLLEPESTCPLSEAYCRKTIQRESLLAVQNAPEEGWENDPAYERISLDTYIGSQVLVDGELYGTFCFADTEPRTYPFTERERTFVELMTTWTSYQLTQQRTKQQLKRQNERLDKFAGILSHDLRNPLNIAQGHTAIAADKTDRASRHLRKVRQALNRMEDITRETLLLARRGDTVDDGEPILIVGLVEQSWEMVDTEDASLDVEDTFTIHGDRDRLRHVFENLFRNAVEHGGEDVTVRVGQMDEEGFYVADDGSGLPGEQQDALFSSEDATAEDEGLGLTIVRRVAEAHDWDVAATEAAEGGARFEFTDVEMDS